ncbi:MAG: S41 family peptidase [Kiritimatiellia bacterium]
MNRSCPRIVWGIIAGAFLLLSLLAAELPEIRLSDKTVPEDGKLAYEQIARFTLAMEQIHALYVKSGNPISYEELIDGAIAGMMSRLDDHSQYMDSETLQSLQETTRGAFGGVGIVISRSGEWIQVVSPIEDSPGWEVGLISGDQIRRIDGASARGISIEEAVNRLRGEPGSSLRLGIRRPSENRSFEVELIRAEIKTPSVSEAALLTENIGYLRIKTFTEETAQLLRRELTTLNRKGAGGVILDLRGNPGGLLSSAVEVCGLFLPRDTLVVSTQSREPSEKKVYATKSTPHRFSPDLVILINRSSASAAEVVSGALQDHGRARLVGETSFGKASVQSIVPLPDGSALKLTTANYFTPADRQIQGKGIEPDVVVDFPLQAWFRLNGEPGPENWEQDPQLRKAVELLQDGGSGP